MIISLGVEVLESPPHVGGGGDPDPSGDTSHAGRCLVDVGQVEQIAVEMLSVGGRVVPPNTPLARACRPARSPNRRRGYGDARSPDPGC